MSQLLTTTPAFETLQLPRPATWSEGALDGVVKVCVKARKAGIEESAMQSSVANLQSAFAGLEEVVYDSPDAGVINIRETKVS